MSNQFPTIFNIKASSQIYNTEIIQKSLKARDLFPFMKGRKLPKRTKTTYDAAAVEKNHDVQVSHIFRIIPSHILCVSSWALTLGP